MINSDKVDEATGLHLRATDGETDASIAAKYALAEKLVEVYQDMTGWTEETWYGYISAVMDCEIRMDTTGLKPEFVAFYEAPKPYDHESFWLPLYDKLATSYDHALDGGIGHEALGPYQKELHTSDGGFDIDRAEELEIPVKRRMIERLRGLADQLESEIN